MAVTAKFLADFASFQEAVDKADAKLVSFQGTTANVERSLNRMIDNFSGRKVIEDAVKMAEAVDRVGGTSKLTESELARVTAQATEASAKLKAMGLDVPPGIQKIADASKEAVTVLSRMTNDFSGRKIIDDAIAMAAAVDRVGGTSKLTESELQRVSAQAAEAAAKMKVMGVEVPPGIQRIADATKDAASSTGGWLPILREMGGSWVARIAEGMLLRDAIRDVISVVKEAAAALPEIALKGAAVADVEENFKRLTAQAGLLGDKLMGTLREGTHGTITDFELMKTVNRDLGAGLTLTDQQFGTLAKGAFALAQATGGSVKDGLDAMNESMVKGAPKAAQALIGKVDLEAAERKYAAALGTTRDNLSEAGKIEAARAAILDGVAAATKRLGDQTDGLDERVAQGSVAWANFKENLGKAIATSSVLEAGMTGLKDALAKTFGSDQQAIIDGIVKKIDEAEIAVIELAKYGVSGAGDMVTEYYAVKKVFGDLAQIVEGDALAFEYLALGVAKTGAAITFNKEHQAAAAAEVKRIQENIDSLLTSMTRRGAALQADDAAQSRVDATTARYNTTLQALRDRMAAAADGATAFVGPMQSEADATERGTGAAKKLGESLLDVAKIQADTDATLIAGYDSKIKGLEAMAKASLTAHDFRTQLAAIWQLDAAEQALARSVFDQLGSEKDRAKVVADSVRQHIDLMNQEMAVQLKQAQLVNGAVLAELDAQVKLNAAWGLDAAGAIRTQKGALDVLTDKLEALHLLKVDGIAQSKQEQLLLDEYTVTLRDEALAHDKVATAAVSAAAATEASAGRQVAAISAVTSSYYREIDAIFAATAAANRGFDVSVGTRPGTPNDGSTERGPGVNQGATVPINGVAISNYSNYSRVPGRATGGDVDAGMPYLVGERGPELYIPKTSGTIVPNGAAAPSISISVPITVQGSMLGTTQALGAAVDKAIIAGLKRAGVRLPTGA